jgi:hypothetical protein
MSDEEPCKHQGYAVEFTPAGPKPSCRSCGSIGRLVFDADSETVTDGVQIKAGRIEWSAEDDRR